MKGYVEDLLSSYKDMIKRRNFLESEIKKRTACQVTERDIIESMTFSRPDGERVQTSGPSDKVSRIAMVFRERQREANREILKQYKQEYDNLCAEISYLEYAINNLPGEQRDVMITLVLHGSSWTAAEYNLCMSRMTIQRIRKQAIDALVRYYQRRESSCIHVLLG